MRVETDTVARDVGRIVQAVSLMMVASILVAAVNREFYTIPAFLASAVITGGIGTGLARRYRDAAPPEKRDAMVTAASSWALVGILGGLPFLFIAWTIQVDPFPVWANTPPMDSTTAIFLHPLDAVFESMSGFTGTGLTMAAVEEKLPRSLHWWRSLIEWIGGVGVIVLTVAILRRNGGGGSYTLYESEARSEKIHPSIVTTVQEIWKIFVGLTVGSILLFLLAGMPLWDAINHGMTGIATGGFSVHAESIGYYDSPLIEYATVPIMVAGSIAFPIHYLLFKGELRNFYADLQTRWVFLWFAGGSLALTGILYANGQYATLEETFRVSLFQFVSATSNTGFGSAAVGGGTEQVWSAGATLLTCLGMLTGGAAGSTTSGLKLIRVATLIKGTVWQIQEVFRPDTAIRYLRIGERKLGEQHAEREYTEATVVFVLWITFLAIGVAVLLRVLSPAYPLEYVIFDVMSAQSNVGLDSGITGPGMPDTAKAMLIINMWVGRLEIIPVAVLLGTIFRRFNLYQ
ncbi:Trk-type transport system (probable substrate potassium) (plasmid) [Halobacterium hubeiense]|uniref:Trk-type transport system (Probable substrate potassium) n=1 Tax=Halobacterium hubeiense TaxID=1407499 RepID=A0A0U5HBL5_9EURY|nr:TrkH family potassium uptake protein [Halobacterium hubeiense]CQH64520.1 Trk-type transport system (probable substrate potassium) [Halobacterium hubeiense]